MDQCQAEDFETSSAAVSTVDGSATDEVLGTSDSHREMTALPSYVIGKHADILLRCWATVTSLASSVKVATLTSELMVCTTTCSFSFDCI